MRLRAARSSRANTRRTAAHVSAGAYRRKSFSLTRRPIFCSSRLTPSTTKPCSRYFADSSSRSLNALIDLASLLLKKTTSTTFPRSSFNVNGKVYQTEYEARTTLWEVIAIQLGMTGTNRSCNRASCGACSVLVDGTSIYSCHTLATEAAGKRGRDLVDFLGQANLFEEFSRSDLARLARSAHERNYRDGESIYEQGTPGAALFLVRRGVVEIALRKRNGEEVPIATLEPPASFSEQAVMGAHVVRWNSARARGPVCLVAFGSSDLDALGRSLPQLANKILRKLAQTLAIPEDELARIEADLAEFYAASGWRPMSVPWPESVTAYWWMRSSNERGRPSGPKVRPSGCFLSAG